MAKFDGTPIEDAPWWALGILSALLWLVFFPALVGLTGSLRGPWGGGGVLALAAGAISVLVVIGLKRQKRWRRPTGKEMVDSRPVFVRFSTWLITVFLYPNVLHGALVIFTGGEPWPYGASLLVGLMVSGIQGIGMWSARRHGRARRPAPTKQG